MTRVGQRMGSGGARRDGSPLSATGWFHRPAPARAIDRRQGHRQQTVYPPPRQTPTRERRIRSERPPSPSGTIRATPPPIRPAKNRRGERSSGNGSARSARGRRASTPKRDRPRAGSPGQRNRGRRALKGTENLKRGARPFPSRGRPHTLCVGVTSEEVGPVATGPSAVPPPADCFGAARRSRATDVEAQARSRWRDRTRRAKNG
jgi:hypothetical protein